MKTEVILSRVFADSEIRQLSKTGFLCATDLTEIYNVIQEGNNMPYKRMKDFFENLATKDFLESLCNELNLQEKSKGRNSALYFPTDLKVVKRGKNNKGTWLHPYLFVKYAMWLSPDFEAKMIIWITDNLLEYRNQSGDKYNVLCKAMSEYGLINDPLDYARVAKAIRFAVTGTNSKDIWNSATTEQLQQRTDIETFLTNAITAGFITKLNMIFEYVGKQRLNQSSRCKKV